MITLISDLDGTLIGDKKGLEVFREFAEARSGSLSIIYATGRNAAEFEAALETENLPQYDGCILNTGADIFIRQGGDYIRAREWRDKIGLNWEKEKILAGLRDMSGIQMQGKDETYKISYFVDEEKAADIRRSVEEKFEEHGIKADVLLSHGVFMDILPAGCDKGSAGKYLMEKTGRGNTRVIAAGDSENDTALFKCFKGGIVVSNARQGFIEEINADDHYMAEAPYGCGVVEGIKYYMRMMR
ncbi:MAG: HAD-IIB family hydrolase [Candidatus Goldiibacteriota bacterium]